MVFENCNWPIKDQNKRSSNNFSKKSGKKAGYTNKKLVNRQWKK
jgi:hypothetical protein